MRQLQLQPGEKAADRVESGADLVPGRLNGSDNRRLDSVPDGSAVLLIPLNRLAAVFFTDSNAEETLLLIPSTTVLIAVFMPFQIVEAVVLIS